FPGPGLAIRVIGDVTAERLEILRRADAVLQDEIRNAGLYRELWQSFAVLPAIHSVGVMGDARTYAYPTVSSGRPPRPPNARQLGPPPLRPARTREQPYHQRGRRRQPRGVGHYQQA